ncbi:hypothetical protein PIB30_094020 [Stylosanthes scabra]|uniref:Uncharacterized protein n=1 Tax=Stylosanthes scabra TaxID=79078 RepID=A0ABU6UW32_9FABA|nr:hypothetical protein [Stylosanthes scabra]
MASSSSVSVFDNYRFKTAFNEELYNTIVKNKKVQRATTDFEIRKEHDQQLDRVLADLCMPGATWKLSTGQQRVPIQLRRQELNPIARGKIEERKLADQETEFGSKTEQGSTHMRAAHTPTHG